LREDDKDAAFVAFSFSLEAALLLTAALNIMVGFLFEQRPNHYGAKR